MPAKPLGRTVAPTICWRSLKPCSAVKTKPEQGYHFHRGDFSACHGRKESGATINIQARLLEREMTEIEQARSWSPRVIT
jgi:hypothetical protein